MVVWCFHLVELERSALGLYPALALLDNQKLVHRLAFLENLGAPVDCLFTEQLSNLLPMAHNFGLHCRQSLLQEGEELIGLDVGLQFAQRLLHLGDLELEQVWLKMLR